MKKTLIVATVLAVSAGAALAGQPDAPILDPAPIADVTTGSSSGILLPLILLVLVAAAAAN